MFSRFSRRGLCFLLALVTLCMCLSPALTQPAEAVAGIDDATLAVGMLFLGWAGVSFATNDAAITCTTNFLNSSVAGLKAASEVAANFVVDGSLKLVQDVKDAFSNVLPDIKATFRTPNGSTTGALAGSYPVGVPIDVPFDGSYVSVDGNSSVFSFITDDRSVNLHLEISKTSDGLSQVHIVDSSGRGYGGVIGTSNMTFILIYVALSRTVMFVLMFVTRTSNTLVNFFIVFYQTFYLILLLVLLKFKILALKATPPTNVLPKSLVKRLLIWRSLPILV